MNRSAKTWLLFMMVPFFIGVLIHFLVPLQIIITANPKLQQAYNGYKIEVEQNTVRALAFLNSRVITNRMQMYENIRSTFIRLLERKDMYQAINLTDIVLNSAQQLANQNNVTELLNSSMWYSPSFSTLTELLNDSIASQLFLSYAQLEPFVSSIFNSEDEIYKGLLTLETTIVYNDTEIYFQYPSYAKSAFASGNASLMTSMFNNSLANYDLGYTTTIFDEGKYLQSCTVIPFNNVSKSGIMCLGLDIMILVKDITSVLGAPQFQLSTNQYYLVRPLYKFQNLVYPEIVGNFTSNNLTDITIPSKTYFNLTTNPIPRQMFLGNKDFQLNIQRHERTKTYYTIPIMLFNYNDNFNVSIYLIVLNNFAKAQLAEQSRNQRIAIIMIVPSVLLLLISIVVTTLILRSILRKLDEALCLMGEYCSLIKRGDLELEIPEYTETQDLKELFQELQKLNELNKYSDINYFNVPKPERIIRFLKCLKLFDELNYDKTNLYENIAECYVEIGEIQNAIKFLRLSVNMTIEELYGNQEEVSKIYETKLNKKSKNDKSLRKKQKIIKRKVLRLCTLLHMTYQNGNDEGKQQLTSKSQLLRKISYPDVLNFQYIGCLFFIISCNIKTGDLAEVQSKMDILHDLIKGYEQINQGNQNCECPPDVMQSYWFSLAATLKMQQKKYIQAYELYVKALQGNRFNPMIHEKAHKQIQKILQIHGINKDELKKFKYTEQYKPRLEREYIFLIDVGKPDIDVQRIALWKKKARRMADHIFNKQVRGTDRVSITEFCLDIKIVCNLIEKGNREKILKRELMSSIKARDQTINGLLMPCLRKTIERARNLKKQKIFIIFLKGGVIVNGDDIYEEIEDVQNSKFIFMVQDIDTIRNKNQNFYVLELEDETGLDRILDEKVWKQADNIMYIL